MLTSILPTTGMLFSDWQATVQTLQPMHDARSMDMPHCGPFVNAGAPGPALACDGSMPCPLGLASRGPPLKGLS